MLPAVLLLFYLSGLVQSAMVKDTNLVTLTATPSVYQDVLTRDVSLNCSLPLANQTDFANVISLILSKTNPGNDDTFNEIASVTAYSHNNPDVRNITMGAHGTGHVAANSDAFLALKWNHPNSSVSGRYRCEAFGVDKLGHPMTSTTDIVIVESPVDVPDALDKVKELYTTIDQLKQWEALSEKLLAHCNSGNPSSNLTPLYDGSYYFFYGPAKMSLAAGQAFCMSFGGYLAEIDNQAEYTHVQSFVKSKLGSSDSWVMLGATDEKVEGSWVYAHSDRPVTFLDWGSGHSGSHSYNCMYFHRQSRGWRMEDGHCNEATRYVVCEIPVSI